MTPDELATALLGDLAAREASPGHLLYLQHLVAWGESQGLSTSERNGAAATCIERGWLERSDSPVRGAYRLTDAGHLAMHGAP